MRRHLMKKRSGLQSYNWHCVVGGEDCDHCLVEFFVQSPEPDVNVPGGIELECIWYEDEGNIIDRASEEELEKIANELIEYMNDLEESYYD
jgi:hypothetical protein